MLSIPYTWTGSHDAGIRITTEFNGSPCIFTPETVPISSIDKRIGSTRDQGALKTPGNIRDETP
jgi:hypothetical protein